MGDYFDAVADARGLQRPPRISRAEAVQQIEPALLSFMSESRRLLNQLKETVTGLGNARVVRSLNPGWRSEVHTVAQLVGHCMRNGLSFGPAAAAEDEPAYTAAYYAIRNYERGLVGNTAVTTAP